MAHNKDCKPCAYCRNNKRALEARRARRYQKIRAYLEAKRVAILSGKVIVLWLRDDVTGMHYRYDKQNGRTIAGGRGQYNEA